jgi:hypothetical protein
MYLFVVSFASLSPSLHFLLRLTFSFASLSPSPVLFCCFNQTKMMLCVSLVLMSLSCYIFFLYGEDCFHAFELTDSTEGDLDGSALNLVKPLGWVGMGLFTAARIMFKLFFMKTARIMRGLQDGTLVHKDITMREKPAKQVIISPTSKKAIV